MGDDAPYPNHFVLGRNLVTTFINPGASQHLPRFVLNFIFCGVSFFQFVKLRILSPKCMQPTKKGVGGWKVIELTDGGQCGTPNCYCSSRQLVTLLFEAGTSVVVYTNLCHRV